MNDKPKIGEIREINGKTYVYLSSEKTRYYQTFEDLVVDKLQNIEKIVAKENERLKEDFKDTTDGLLKIQYTLADSCKKYEQALQEIREIAEELKSPHCTDFTQFLNKKGKCTGECMYDYKKIILAKINEVIGAE